MLFVAFGKEERGLLGSRAMVKSIPQEELAQYCAMINIDSLGLADPQVVVNISSKALVDRAVELAQRMKMPFSKANIPGGLSDSITFIDKKIPALTISGVANGYGEVLHTDNDQVAKVNPISLYLAYRLALALVADLNNIPCGTIREAQIEK
jgi:Zn-dependent M28 family amino/carboxypeptidase